MKIGVQEQTQLKNLKKEVINAESLMTTKMEELEELFCCWGADENDAQDYMNSEKTLEEIFE